MTLWVAFTFIYILNRGKELLNRGNDIELLNRGNDMQIDETCY